MTVSSWLPPFLPLVLALVGCAPRDPVTEPVPATQPTTASAQQSPQAAAPTTSCPATQAQSLTFAPLPTPAGGQVMQLDPLVVYTPSDQRWTTYPLGPNRPARTYAAANPPAEPLTAVADDALWVVRGEPGHDTLDILRLTATNVHHIEVKPASCPLSCEVRAHVARADADGLWIGGYAGVHSSQVSFEGWVLHLNASGQITTEAQVNAFNPGKGFAVETQVSAIHPLANGGAAVAGHHLDPTLNDEREWIWTARIAKDGAVHDRTTLPGADRHAKPGTLALWAEPDGTRYLAWATGTHPACKASLGTLAILPLGGPPTLHTDQLVGPSGPWSIAKLRRYNDRWAWVAAGPQGLVLTKWETPGGPITNRYTFNLTKPPTQLALGSDRLWVGRMGQVAEWVNPSGAAANSGPPDSGASQGNPAVHVPTD